MLSGVSSHSLPRLATAADWYELDLRCIRSELVRMHSVRSQQAETNPGVAGVTEDHRGVTFL